ncbi:acyltransferase [Apibacter muscae]|uniref:acyltransferase n=1 Tax=Apibacter muscae TaxID=2509004 RepID=UPI0011AD76DC|nr:acyltransferase [Apibacter muscae]TWP24886.1 acyltransferase [Apibacter muscae]
MKSLIQKFFYYLGKFQKKLSDEYYLKKSLERGLKLGKNVIFIEMPNFGSEPFLIEIGDNTKITAGVRFINHDGGTYVIRSMDKYKDARSLGRIQIGNNCFIGNNCIILPRVKMGNNCILGAGSVLTTSMPANSVYAGIPAKFICTIEDYGDKIIKNNVLYPRILEKNRKDLEDFWNKNLPHAYKEKNTN